MSDYDYDPRDRRRRFDYRLNVQRTASWRPSFSQFLVYALFGAAIGFFISGGNPIITVLFALGWPLMVPFFFFSTIVSLILAILVGVGLIWLLFVIFGD